MVKVERQRVKDEGHREVRTNVRGEVAGGAYHVLTYSTYLRSELSIQHEIRFSSSKVSDFAYFGVNVAEVTR
jgi:hypothetical protein